MRFGAHGQRAAAAGFLLFQSYRQHFTLRGLMQDGQGYAAQAWRESQAWDHLCERPAIPIYTNDLAALYFHCHRVADGLSSPILAATGRPNPAYARQLAEFHQRIRRKGGLVAFVGWYGEARLERTGLLELVAGLRLTDTFDDGPIYSP